MAIQILPEDHEGAISETSGSDVLCAKRDCPMSPREKKKTFFIKKRKKIGRESIQTVSHM